MGGDAIQNHLRHRIGISQNIAIPESQHPITLRFQPASAISVIGRALQVLSAINLYDYFALETDEVPKVGADRLLTPELHASELATLEFLPETLLRFGRSPRAR